MVAPRELRMWKNAVYWPQISEMHMKGMISMSPDSCASSHTKKSTKFLNMMYLVFFNSQKYFWHSDYLPFSCKFLHNLAPHPCPHHPQSSSLRVTWDAISWAWSPKNSHWVKHNSQLLGCDYFLSWQSIGTGSVWGMDPKKMEAFKGLSLSLASPRSSSAMHNLTPQLRPPKSESALSRDPHVTCIYIFKSEKSCWKVLFIKTVKAVWPRWYR